MEGVNLRTDREIGALPLKRVERLALSVAQTPSDVVFLSWTNMPTLPLLDDLGNMVDRPVISSNPATIWGTLRRMNGIPSRAACFATRRSGAAGLVRLGNDSSEQQVHPEPAPSLERKQ
jgi:maleate cis-trans isomerase